ncbi:DUF3592 domain-containing protein [Streptomyces sp. NPDC006739]|uniref:DUF3592 domain-containing protein n=1 Tax=Streptomyces sp. NPDC006739 TaxID=3364763 RepID=UPI0036892488
MGDGVPVSAGVGSFGVVFGVVGLLFASIGVAGGVRLVRRRAMVHRVLTKGLVAEGLVLETYLSVHGRQHVTTSRRAIIAFRTADGAEHRIYASPRRPLLAGDRVLVRYLPEAPERAVTADAASGGSSALMLLPLAFLGVFVIIGLFFAATGFGMAHFGFAGSASPAP